MRRVPVTVLCTSNVVLRKMREMYENLRVWEAPVSATSVAKATIVGALGKSTASILDTHDKILEASNLV